MPAPDRRAFVASLRLERDAVARFLGLLESESAALVRGDLEELARISGAKHSEADTLSALSDARLAFLRSAGFAPDRAGMSEWLLVHGGREHEFLSRLWHDLVQDAGTAKRLNENNGVMIDARLRFSTAALTALETAMHHQSPMYGPDGTQAFRNPGRPLGLA